LILGDFNARPGRATHSSLVGGGWRDAWEASRPGDAGYTAGKKRIDYVFWDERANAGRVRVLTSWRRGTGAEGDPKLSDHRAVLSTLEIRH
jgi:endonuclease/exonuclease/phosphatase family metal-dependent hydrolase